MSDDVKQMVQDLGDKILASHEETRQELVKIRSEIAHTNRSLKRLWRRVVDSDVSTDDKET